MKLSLIKSSVLIGAVLAASVSASALAAPSGGNAKTPSTDLWGNRMVSTSPSSNICKNEFRSPVVDSYSGNKHHGAQLKAHSGVANKTPVGLSGSIRRLPPSSLIHTEAYCNTCSFRNREKYL